MAPSTGSYISTTMTNVILHISRQQLPTQYLEICLRRLLRVHYFYSAEEYFQHKSITSWKCAIKCL